MELLKKLCDVSAVSANESELAKLILEEISPYADEAEIDCLGNVIARKKGNKDKIMLTARMDECGGLVTLVEESGLIRFNAVGEYAAENIINMTADFGGGLMGIICCDDGKKEDIKFSDLFVDIGALSYDEAAAKVNIGDVFCVREQSILNENVIISKGAGVRGGVYALIEAFKSAKETDNDIYAVFAGRSQVGFKGVKFASDSIEPKIAVSLGDAGESKGIKSSGGVVISLKSQNSLSDKELSDKIRSICDENKISYVCDVSKSFQTEGAMIKTSGEGVRQAGLLLPVKYAKAPRQSVSIKDIDALTELIGKIMASEFNF